MSNNSKTICNKLFKNLNTSYENSCMNNKTGSYTLEFKMPETTLITLNINQNDNIHSPILFLFSKLNKFNTKNSRRKRKKNKTNEEKVYNLLLTIYSLLNQIDFKKEIENITPNQSDKNKIESTLDIGIHKFILNNKTYDFNLRGLNDCILKIN